jgi:hypothetical protein
MASFIFSSSSKSLHPALYQKTAMMYNTGFAERSRNRLKDMQAMDSGCSGDSAVNLPGAGCQAPQDRRDSDAGDGMGQWLNRGLRHA